jgi:hypothetical protein
MILQRAQNPNIGGVKRDGLHLGTDCRLGTVQGGQFQGHIRVLFTPPDLQMPANVGDGTLNGRCSRLLQSGRDNQEAEEA